MASLPAPATPPWPVAPTRPAAPGTYPEKATEFAFRKIEYERRERINRTKTGLLLLIIGTAVGVLPFVNFIGGIVALIGAILVNLGRYPFGKAHSDYVLWSVGIYIAGLIIIFAFSIGFTIALVQTVVSGASSSALADAFSSSFNDLLLGVFVGAAVTGVAQVLFTYALQKPLGRGLLWAAYIGGLVIGVYVLSVIGSQIPSAVQAAFAGSSFNRAPIDTLRAQETYLRLLGIIPAAIYALAYYLAWSQINKGKIPALLGPTSTTSPTLN